jgi:sugar (pentulose or hexulose) kinase
MAELKAYQSSVSSVAKLVGAGIKEQALIMIPFEIAEATKEMADFFATKDPSHLAASLKHALAVKQYADAAKTSAPSSSGGASGGSASAPSAEPERGQPEHHARVVVNVGDGVVINPKEFTRQLVEGLNEAYRDNVRIEFA